MGIRGSYTTAFAFDDLRIPAENLLGQEGQGFKIAMETLNGGRIGIASQALGIAEGAFERALAYSKERKQFGAPICDLQAIQFKLADMYSRIETSKLLVYKAAWMKDSKMNYAMESAMCKMCASETATYVTKEAMQIHGGYGYIADYEVERMYRDAKITEIYEGTNEVQRVVISKTAACLGTSIFPPCRRCRRRSLVRRGVAYALWVPRLRAPPRRLGLTKI